MTVLSTISLCSYIWFFEIDQSATYFLMPFRFWELGIGCITFLIISSKNQALKALKYLNFIPTIITILIIVFLFTPQIFINKSTIAVVLLTALLIGTLNDQSAIFKVFTWKPIVSIGLISYSLYLWHWSILVISRWTIGIDWWTLPIQIGIIFVISLFSYKYVEIPLRHAKWSASKLLTIAYGILASCIAAFIIYLGGNQFLGMLYVGQIPDFIKTTWWHDQNGKYIEYCHVKTIYSDQVFQKCIIDKTKSNFQQNNKNNIYIFGDSHSRNYVKGITKAFPEYNVSYITMGYGCAFMPENQIKANVEAGTACKSYVARVRNFVKNDVNKNDIVFVSQHRGHQADVGYQENIFELAKYAHLRGAKFIFAADLPELLVDPMNCFKQPWRKDQPAICFRTIFDVISEQNILDKIGTTLESQSSNSHYLDVRKYLCVDQLCSLYKEDTPLYHDRGHITDEASEMLAPYIREKLEDFVFSR